MSDHYTEQKKADPLMRTSLQIIYLKPFKILDLKK